MLRLREPLEELGVRVFAGDKDGGPVSVKPDLLLVYLGSSFGDPQGGDGVGQQSRIMRWQLSLRLRDLRTHEALYPIEQVVLYALKGFSPDPCLIGAIYPLATRLRPRDEQGYWGHEFMFGLKERFPNE